MALLAVAGVWALSAAGFFLARNARITAAKVQAYAQTVASSRMEAFEMSSAVNSVASV